MPRLKLSLNILNWSTALPASALAVSSLMGVVFAKGAYHFGHTAPAENFSTSVLPRLACQIIQVALLPAIASVVFLIPSVLLVSRNRPVLAAALALAPYGPLIWFLWMVSASAGRQ